MKKKNIYISLFTALSIIIHGFEYMIPVVTPWFKLGLANSVSLAVLVVYGLKDALFVTLLRIFISSIIFGTFLGPAFFLSLSGGIVSITTMGFFYYLANPFLSTIGISLLGAYSHILAQGFVISKFMIGHDSIFLLIPGMLLLSLVTGIINGTISSRLCTHLMLVKQKEKLV